MQTIKKTDLRLLMEHRNQHCVSIYMQTDKTGIRIAQDLIRLKDLLKEAELTLTGRGMPADKAKELLCPVHDLISLHTFWKFQRNGCAFFIARGLLKYYSLPVEFRDIAVVGDSFYVKPLLPYFSGDARFYILALSQNDVHFYSGTRYGFDEIKVRNIPSSRDEALKFHKHEKLVMYHTSSASGRGESTFYGQNDGTNEPKEDTAHYLQKINTGIHDFLRDEQSPLVLAGPMPITSAYKSINTYPYTVEEIVAGNAGLIPPKELHDKAWKILEPKFAGYRQKYLDAYKESESKGRGSGDIREIIKAAYNGRVNFMFISPEKEIWGRFSSDFGDIVIHAQRELNDVELLDFAAVHCLQNNGTVIVTEKEIIPCNNTVAAVFRY